MGDLGNLIDFKSVRKSLQSTIEQDYKPTAICGLMTGVGATYSAVFGKLLYDGQLNANDAPAIWLLMPFLLATTGYFAYQTVQSLKKS